MKNLKELREMTGLGLMDCKNALDEAKGDLLKAQNILRQNGLIKAGQKLDRPTKEGRIFNYVHTSGKIGATVILGCETDFVARNEKLAELGNKLCMHIVALEPEWISVATMDMDFATEIMNKCIADVPEKAPKNMKQKIADGKFGKWASKNVLLYQKFVMDETMTIADLIAEYINRLGENIIVKSFTLHTV